MGKFIKECAKCKAALPVDNFIDTKSQFFIDGKLSICNSCLEKMMVENENNFTFFDKLCQWADLPFLTEEWDNLYRFNKEKTFALYAKIVAEAKYEGIDWKIINTKYKEIEKEGRLEDKVPSLQAERLLELHEKWGPHYDNEQLLYLENLFQGILNTQNVVGDIQLDNAKKLCKISLVIDDKIRAGEDFKDELSSYEKIIKITDFTPKNIKNATDFSSIGEVFAFLEKKGWLNPFYDGVERDIVDSTMKNIQVYTRNLYVNESGISEEIDRKLESLKIAQEIEEQYDEVGGGDDLDSFEIQGYDLEEFEEEIR